MSFVLPTTTDANTSDEAGLAWLQCLTSDRQTENADTPTMDQSAALLATLFVAVQFSAENRADKARLVV
jgi:hypothetical protein